MAVETTNSEQFLCTSGERVYLSSSWKNRERVRALAVALRAAGHEVYDFTDPNCRKAPEIPPEAFPVLFDPERHNYREYINSVPHWRQAVEGSREALNWCSLVVLMLPCGNDGHADWAYAVGLGKRTVVVGHPRAGDRSPTHMWAEAILDTDSDVLPWLCAKRDRETVAAILREHNCEDLAESPMAARIAEALAAGWQADADRRESAARREERERCAIVAACFDKRAAAEIRALDGAQ